MVARGGMQKSSSSQFSKCIKHSDTTVIGMVEKNRWVLRDEGVEGDNFHMVHPANWETMTNTIKPMTK